MRNGLLVLGLALAFVGGMFIDVPASANKETQVEDRMANQEGQAGRRHAKRKMTAGEQARADNATYRMTAEESAMKTKHDGKLTRRDQRMLNRQLNRNERRMR